MIDELKNKIDKVTLHMAQVTADTFDVSFDDGLAIIMELRLLCIEMREMKAEAGNFTISMKMENGGYAHIDGGASIVKGGVEITKFSLTKCSLDEYNNYMLEDKDMDERSRKNFERRKAEEKEPQ